MANNAFVEEARKQLQGGMDSQLSQLNNQFAQNMGELNSQLVGINKNYETSVQNAKEQGEMNKANYNANTLSRGLSRSTVATTGIAGIDNTTNKNIVTIDNQRLSQLDNLAKLKTMLNDNLMNSKNALMSQFNSNVSSLAQQLQQRAEDVAFRNRQLAAEQSRWAQQQALQREQWEFEKQYKTNQMESEKLKAEKEKKLDPTIVRNSLMDDYAIASANGDGKKKREIRKEAIASKNADLKDWFDKADKEIPLSPDNYVLQNAMQRSPYFIGKKLAQSVSPMKDFYSMLEEEKKNKKPSFVRPQYQSIATSKYSYGMNR